MLQHSQHIDTLPDGAIGTHTDSANPYATQVVQLSTNTMPQASESNVQYSGFWQRLAASFFDNAVTTSVGFGIVLLLHVLNAPIPQIVSNSVPLLFFWFYFSLMESSNKQSTFGKRILGVKVTGIDGNKISFLHATGRTFAKFFSVISLGIGFLMISFTKKKQGLHDIIAGTLVVQK